MRAHTYTHTHFFFFFTPSDWWVLAMWRGSRVPGDTVGGGFVVRMCMVVVLSCDDDG